jgi:hypothetical protein
MTQKEQIQRFDNLVEKLRQTLSSKGKDYASEDVLSNFKESAERIGQKPYEQCLSMISQKVSRLSNLFKQDRKPNNESVQDSILDLIGYSFLLDAIIEEQNSWSKILEGEALKQGIAPNSFQGDFNINFEENNTTGSKYQTTLEKEFIAAITEEGKAVDRKFSEKEMQEYLDDREQKNQDFIEKLITGDFCFIHVVGENFRGIAQGVSIGDKIHRIQKLKEHNKKRLEKQQAELMQRILLLSLVNQLTRSEKDKQELTKCFDELISITEKLGEDTTELKQERSKLNG